jgi:hypothetical protein
LVPREFATACARAATGDKTAMGSVEKAACHLYAAQKPLDMPRDGTQWFNGEDQIQGTLTSNPLKLYLDLEYRPRGWKP